MTIEEIEESLRHLRHQQESRKRIHWRRNPPKLPSDTELAEVNWKIVAGIAFGIFVWYVGYAFFDYLISPH